MQGTLTKGGRLSTVDFLNKTACFVKKYIFILKAVGLN
jgi:hypothetical protein